ncbi:hypothetical protein PR001_g29834 [Phytophthora rubi]|uniref:SWIM-type domain-containing protein n=1 Tax=Phytophthora rubi TaxID=129364 RepID=A0A6A3GZC0_9STRA|nr:hypothetical protein PR001_g29834 [Phytophthora rubi]
MAPPPSPSLLSSAPPSLLSQPTEDMIAEGMCFSTQKACTAAMRTYAANHGMVVRLDSRSHGGAFLTYRCEGGAECRFKVTARRSKKEGQTGYVISTCNMQHNQCGRLAKLTSTQIRHDDGVIALIASDPTISARAIVEYVRRTKAAVLTENEAHRAKKKILDDLYGSIEDSFSKLHSLVEVWRAKNPTSIAECEFNAEGGFVRVFISHPYAARYSTDGQRVGGVDGAFLRHGKYKNIHMILVGRDGNSKNMILAIALCAKEDGDNCEWFFRSCLRAGVKINAMPLFSDRGSGIMSALETLSITTLRYCTRHILNNIRDNFKGRIPPDLTAVVYRIQGAQSFEEYDGILKTIELTHADIGAYIRNIKPDNWVLYTALRTCRLYGWRTTNFVESQNAAGVGPRHMLPFQFLDFYMTKFMKDACENREKLAQAWQDAGHRITEYARKTIDLASEEAAFCAVDQSQGGHLYVYDTRNNPVIRREVNIDARICSCTVYDQYGIPCKHFIAALNFLDRRTEKYDAVDTCYTVDAYASLYGSNQPRIQLVLPEELTINTSHRPPKLISKKGKKRERRLPSRGDTTLQVGKAKRTMKCSQCGQSGHNKRSCTS